MYRINSLDDITFGMKVKYGTTAGMTAAEIDVVVDICLADDEMANRFIGHTARDERDVRESIATQLRAKEPSLEWILARELTIQEVGGEHKVKAAEAITFEIPLEQGGIVIEGELHGLTMSREPMTRKFGTGQLPEHDQIVHMGGPKNLHALLRQGEVVGFSWKQENNNNWKQIFLPVDKTPRHLVSTFSWCKGVFETHHVNDAYPPFLVPN